MVRTISSPKENVAEKPLTIIQDAQTRIKETIVECYYQNLSKAEIEKRIAVIIQEAFGKLPDSIRESARMSLAINAQKWHYLYTESMKVLNASMIRTLAKWESTIPGMRAEAKTYSINLAEMIGAEANVQKEVIDRFRPFLTKDDAGLAIIENYEKRVKDQIKVLAADPANLQRIDKNGKPYKVNLRNFSEMHARYEANQEDIKRLESEGVKLVWTSSHPDASPRCAPYQGRLYSMDGSSGSIDGIKYTPLDEALLGPRGDGNGIINGYNCRHRLIEYTPKSGPPKEYDKATINRENAINNRQRQYERDIRNLKIQERLANKSGDDQGANGLQKEWQKLMKDYERYSLRNQRAYYPWRTRVTNEETDTSSV